ncbi:MAG: nitrous oxide reductase accessory protein NosL [Pseudomonadota bacterium]
MISRPLIVSSVVLIALLLTGCNDQDELVELPGPIAMTEEAVGHYCNMNILEHRGPKAQIHLANLDHPIWFSQVRDAIAYTRLPEETHEPVAIYVNDMGKSTEWDFPGDDSWIDIQTAFFVINSGRTGGMGAPEAIPFGDKNKAELFAKNQGGEVVQLDGISDDYVLGPVELKPLDDKNEGES